MAVHYMILRQLFDDYQEDKRILTNFLLLKADKDPSWNKVPPSDQEVEMLLDSLYLRRLAFKGEE